MNQPDATPAADAPATPLEDLRASLATLDRAPLLHKGEAAGVVMVKLVRLLEDQDARITSIEAELGAIVHPARDRRRPA